MNRLDWKQALQDWYLKQVDEELTEDNIKEYELVDHFMMLVYENEQVWVISYNGGFHEGLIVIYKQEERQADNIAVEI